MKLLEAIELLKQGKAVRRESWKKPDGYLVFMPEMRHVWKIIIHPAPNAGNHIFSVEEICAEDYIEYNGYCDDEHGHGEPNCGAQCDNV